MKLLLPLLVGVVASACAHTTREGRPAVVTQQDALMDQAAFQMSCSRENLTVAKVADNTAGIEGCDKKALYKFVYPTGWVMNTEGEK